MYVQYCVNNQHRVTGHMLDYTIFLHIKDYLKSLPRIQAHCENDVLMGGKSSARRGIWFESHVIDFQEKRILLYIHRVHGVKFIIKNLTSEMTEAGG